MYLESIKPVMQLEAYEGQRHATQTVLYACLHYGAPDTGPYTSPSP